MLKAFKYRIYPNQFQKQKFAEHFGCARFVYNWALNKKETFYKKTKKNLSKRMLQDQLVALKKEQLWLTDVNSQTLLASLFNLDTAFTKFFKRSAKYPRFKKRYAGKQSYQCPQHVQVNFANNMVNLPKIKNIKAKLHREFEGRIKTCTISRIATNNYYISILVENGKKEPAPAYIEKEKKMGLDLGIK
ncbi:helix-turn-helix domain-containing protein, partial [Candidatus Babeliales bacterium]|nr:helix-turn-helix domain-containing protein [Candidatus Babeliales bacterium]